MTDSGLPTHHRRSTVAEEYLTEEINVNCNDSKAFAPGSTDLNKLSRFLDKVIEKQFYRRDKKSTTQNLLQQQQQQERRRLL